MDKRIPLRFRGKRGFRGTRGLRDRGSFLKFSESWSNEYGGSRFFADYRNWIKQVTDIICPPPTTSWSDWGRFASPMILSPRTTFNGIMELDNSG